MILKHKKNPSKCCETCENYEATESYYGEAGKGLCHFSWFPKTVSPNFCCGVYVAKDKEDM
jgi:hypothetical protein